VTEIDHAAALLRAGQLVAFPTETVYGLGANALDADAVKRIFEAKGRPFSSPLIVHVASIEMARELAADWPPAASGSASRRTQSHEPFSLPREFPSLRQARTASPNYPQLPRRTSVKRFRIYSCSTADHVPLASRVLSSHSQAQPRASSGQA
jgi:hypothetical protein